MPPPPPVPTPSTPSPLQERLAALRGPSGVQSDVDAALQALGQPPSGGETPRERAHLLLALLEDAEVREATGSDGRTVRAAAVEAMLALGYPYALELPPEVLAQVHDEAARAHRAQGVPGVGLALAGLAVPAQADVMLRALMEARATPLTAALFLGAGVLPVLLAVLGGWRGPRWACWVGVLLMALMGGAFLARFVSELLQPAQGFQEAGALSCAVPAALLLSGAWLLRRRWGSAAP